MKKQIAVAVVLVVVVAVVVVVVVVEHVELEVQSLKSLYPLYLFHDQILKTKMRIRFSSLESKRRMITMVMVTKKTFCRWSPPFYLYCGF